MLLPCYYHANWTCYCGSAMTFFLLLFCSNLDQHGLLCLYSIVFHIYNGYLNSNHSEPKVSHYYDLIPSLYHGFGYVPW